MWHKLALAGMLAGLLVGGGLISRQAIAHARTEQQAQAARHLLRRRLVEVDRPVREAFAHARAAVPAYAQWVNSSWTGARVLWAHTLDWCAPEAVGEAAGGRANRLLRDEFAAQVLSGETLAAAISRSRGEAEAAVAAARIDLADGQSADVTAWVAHGARRHPAAPPADEPGAAPAVPEAAATVGVAAVGYRIIDLGLDGWCTASLAPAVAAWATRAGLQLGALASTSLTLGVSLVVTLVLEMIYDRAVEEDLAGRILAALDAAESCLLDGEHGLVRHLQLEAERCFAEDVQALHAVD